MNRPFIRRRARAAVAGGAAAGLLLLLASVSGAYDGEAEVPVGRYANGQGDLRGDDNRDGRVDEDESGWDCRAMGNRRCGTVVPPECAGAGDELRLCMVVAGRLAYGWDNPDGSRVDVPGGRALVRDLEERPGTVEFGAALRALDAEWRAHR